MVGESSTQFSGVPCGSRILNTVLWSPLWSAGGEGLTFRVGGFVFFCTGVCKTQNINGLFGPLTGTMGPVTSVYGKFLQPVWWGPRCRLFFSTQLGPLSWSGNHTGKASTVNPNQRGMTAECLCGACRIFIYNYFSLFKIQHHDALHLVLLFFV